MNRRLFMQLLVFDCPVGTLPDEIAAEAANQLRARKCPSVLYADTMLSVDLRRFWEWHNAYPLAGASLFVHLVIISNS